MSCFTDMLGGGGTTMTNYSIKDYSDLYNQYSNKNEYRAVPLIEQEWTLIESVSEVNNYLPKPNNVSVTTGISTLKTNNIANFDSVDISDSIPNKRGYIINTGCSIWGLDFVPMPASNTENKQYLAVGGYNSTQEHHKLNEDTPSNENRVNAIQIWKCGLETDSTKPMLDMCIVHDFGIVVDFKWCPFSVYDEEKLGVLAILFGDGVLRLCVVPHPDFVRARNTTTKKEETVYVKMNQARLCLTPNRSEIFCFAWGGYKRLACGTRSGSILVFDILSSLLRKEVCLVANIPSASMLPIRCISWKSLFDEDVLLTSDMDGYIRLHDLKDPFIAIKVFRVRQLFVCVAGSGFAEGFMFAEADGLVKRNLFLNGKKTIFLTSHNSLVWDIASSPHHGIMGSVASNGTAMVKPFYSDTKVFTQNHRNPEFTLYRLEFDSELATFRFIDGLQPKTTIAEREYHQILLDPIAALQKIAWNCNKNACGWIASGGAAGLCRLEFTGCS